MAGKTKWILFVLILIIQSFVLSLGVINYLLFTNTLANNPKWETAKLQLYMPGFDGIVFHNRLPALAYNALNPAAWRGYNEVNLVKPVAWKELEFKYLPSENSYLYLVFHQTNQDFSAIRLSYSPLYRSALMSGKYTGEFTEQFILPVYLSGDTGWQKIALKKTSADSQTVDVYYNDVLITTYHTQTSPAGTIGFRTGSKMLLIDDVMAWNDAGEMVLNEKFDQLEKFWPTYSTCLVFLVVFDLGLWLVFKNNSSRLKSLIRFNFSACFGLILLGLILLGLSSFLRSRYPNPHSEFNQNLAKLQPITAADSSWMQIQTESMFERHALAATDSSITKIMIIGSSQTEGEGSALPNENFVAQFEALVNQNLANQNRKFEIINAGRAGRVASELFTFFRAQWVKLQPDVVILNLSSNDEEYETGEAFRTALEDFIDLSNQKKFRLVFMLEANNIESKPKIKAHQVMRELAEDHGIQVIDANQNIINHQEDGLLWWDFVHLTTFGYKLTAKHLFESIESSL